MSTSFNVQSQGISNGLLRIKITNMRAVSIFMLHIRKYLTFKLEYNILKKSTDLEWQQFLFKYDDYIQWLPEHHINIRLPTNLYDYQIQFRLSLMLSDKCRYIIDNMPENEWVALSNTINITVPSFMRDKSYDINDWIKFRKSSDGRNFYGTVIDKISRTDIPEIERSDLSEINRYFYEIKFLNGNREYEKYKTDQSTIFRDFYVHSYIDLSDRNEADKHLLVGDASEMENMHEIYQALTELFFTDYAVECFDGMYRYHVEFLSMAKSVSINVLEFLYIKDKGYKVRCSLICEHYDDTLRLMGQRKYIIARSLENKKPEQAQEFHYYCDICLCRQGDYDWMYHDKFKTDDNRTNMHDICISCVYDMIKRYEQLSSLMQEILLTEITSDCIQVIVSYVSGDVIKL